MAANCYLVCLHRRIFVTLSEGGDNFFNNLYLWGNPFGFNYNSNCTPIFVGSNLNSTLRLICAIFFTAPSVVTFRPHHCIQNGACASCLFCMFLCWYFTTKSIYWCTLPIQTHFNGCFVQFSSSAYVHSHTCISHTWAHIDIQAGSWCWMKTIYIVWNHTNVCPCLLISRSAPSSAHSDSEPVSQYNNVVRPDGMRRTRKYDSCSSGWLADGMGYDLEYRV